MLLAVFALVAVYLWICFALARNYVHPSRTVPEKPPWLKDVNVDTRFGPTPAWSTAGLADGHPSKLIFVMAHGYGGTRATWTDRIEALSKKGYDCLALALPGQDVSPVKDVGFGITESQVIADAVKWVRSRSNGKSKVVVIGVSMGGAASWLASEQDPTIDGVITEGAYARFDEAMKNFFECKVRGGSTIFAPVITFARWMTGIDPAKVRPVDAAAKWRGKPALVIQGSADSLMTPDQAKDLAEAAGCQEWIVNGAEHAQCYDADPHGYIDHICRFAQLVEKG